MGGKAENGAKYPMVVSTWPFVDAVRAAWKAVDGGLSAIDAVVEGCSACEELRCDGTGKIPPPERRKRKTNSLHKFEFLQGVSDSIVDVWKD